MNKELRIVSCLVAFALMTTSTLLAKVESTVTSPTSGLSASVDITSKIPYIIIKDAAGRQVSKVRLGLNTSLANYSTGMSFVSATEPDAITEQYQAIHGKRSDVSNSANRIEVTLANAQKQEMGIEIRAYEDGVAFRYKLNLEEGKTITFNSELTAYQMQAKAHRWLQPFNTSYEADFPYQASGGRTGTWGYPALFESDGTFCLLTEANVGRSYCSTHLENNANAQLYQVCYPFDYEGYGQGAVNPSWTGAWTSPWRLLIIGSLATVVESTLVEDVSDPCTLTNTNFVLPGRAAWVYWAYNHGTQDYQICRQYVDLAVKMGWEYVLFDWEWEQMGNGGNVEDAVRYATSKKVKPMLWYHSNNGKMQNHDQRVSEFAWLKRIGVKGIKVDFFESDKQHTMQYFADILEDAAKYSIMVNFHGCTVPRGWSRTYPNLMSQEAVFGAEQYNNGGTMTTEGARINCLLTYTRNVIGPMDYTPVAFTNSQHPHTTTYAHELALSVAFESGIQHWADRPEGFYALPYEAQLHMKNVPVAWDETRFLDGYPGKAFVVARRKGEAWYVSCINGEKKTRQQEIVLDFLPAGQFLLTSIADGDDESSFSITHRLVTAADRLTLSCLSQGGFVLNIGNTTYKEVQTLVRTAKTLLTKAQKNMGTAPGQYKESLVDALSAALTTADGLSATSPADALNAAYATIADAYSALEIRGLNEVFNTQGESVRAKSGGTDVTRKYLSQANGFTRSDARNASGDYYRFGTPKFWTVENYEIQLGSDGVKRGIDNYPGYNCLQLGRWEESASKMNDADHANERLYQRVTLPAGRYFLGAKYHYIDGGRQAAQAYLMAAPAVLASADVEKEAIAWGTLRTVGADDNFYGIRFQLDEEQEVVLGWQMDGREEHTEFRCSAVQLLQYPLDIEDGIGRIEEMENGQWTMDNGQWEMEDGQWTMDNGNSSFVTRHSSFSIYDLSGRRVQSSIFNRHSSFDTRHSQSKKGLYLISQNGITRKIVR